LHRLHHSADPVNARYLQCSVPPWSKLGAMGAHAPCVAWDAIIRCIKPDDDAASSVAAGTSMMQQVRPKSAATRADATTRPCVELAYSQG
jgi:hypothetical protein